MPKLNIVLRVLPKRKIKKLINILLGFFQSLEYKKHLLNHTLAVVQNYKSWFLNISSCSYKQEVCLLNWTFSKLFLWKKMAFFHGGSNFFTYVTRTCPHLSTYSRKLGNYNGTIIFVIDIMKKSFPPNLKFTFLPLSKPK